MRYLIITYYKRPNGQMDEVVGISKNLKNKDIAQASVILDFRQSQVVKCSLDGTIVPKDWNKIRDFYHQHYDGIIEELEEMNGKAVAQPQNDPS